MYSDEHDRNRRAAERRQVLRDHPGLRRELDRLAALEVGGSLDRPIEVTSASEVEVRAASLACSLCGGRCRVDDHTVETRGAARRRVARVRCEMCGARRLLYFRIGSALSS